ncbi:MAG: hypothetical protein POG74_06395 [Acidocella sp.]|nr:hypothetical protein [Acidocella sp.]
MTRHHPDGEPVQPQKNGHKSGKHGRGMWFKPGLLQAAVVLLWASIHEPPRFSPTNIGIWVLSTVTVAFIAKSIAILALPLGRIAFAFIQQHLKNNRSGQAGS